MGPRADHSPLRYILSSTKAEGRVSRWLLALSNFHLLIYYRPGDLNVVADCLSRLPIAYDDDERAEDCVRLVEATGPTCLDVERPTMFTTPISSCVPAWVAPPETFCTPAPAWAVSTRRSTRAATQRLTSAAGESTTRSPPTTGATSASATAADTSTATDALFADAPATQASDTATAIEAVATTPPVAATQPTAATGGDATHDKASGAVHVDDADPPSVEKTAARRANPLATSLSRPLGQLDVETDDLDNLFEADVTIDKARAREILTNAEKRDPYHNLDILRVVLGLPLPGGEKPSERLLKIAKQYTCRATDGRVFKTAVRNGRVDETALMVPHLNVRETLLLRAHLLGHFGVRATYYRLLYELRVWWPGMATQLNEHIRACGACLQHRFRPVAQPPAKSIEPPSLFHTVQIDFANGLPPSRDGYVSVCVIVELVSRYVCAYPTKDKSATSAAKALFKYISTFGLFRVLQSDNGPEFRNKVVRQLLTECGIPHVVSSAYHPQTQGATEVKNRDLVKALEVELTRYQRDWPEALDFVLYSFRTKPCKTLLGDQQTPFSVVFGREHNAFEDYSGAPTLATCLPETAMQRQAEIKHAVEIDRPALLAHAVRVKEDQRHRRDEAAERKGTLHQPLKVGDVVYYAVNNHVKKKLVGVRYAGPYKVFELTNPGAPATNYKLVNPLGVVQARAFPLDQLRPMKSTEAAERVWKQHQRESPSAIFYEVDKILDHRVNARTGASEYLLSWKDYPEDFASWQPASDLKSPDMLAEYWGARHTTPPAADVIAAARNA